MSNLEIKRCKYVLNEYEKDLFIKYFSMEEIMQGTAIRKELKQVYNLMIANLFAMAEDEGDGFDIYWNDSDELLINTLVTNRSIILNQEFFSEMKRLNVDFNKPDKDGFNFFIAYLKRSDEFALNLTLFKSLDIDFNYYNKVENMSLGDYFFQSFPNDYMMSTRSSISQDAAKNKLEIFGHVFKVWSQQIESQHDIDQSIEWYFSSKKKFQDYLQKRMTRDCPKTDEEIMEEAQKRAVKIGLNPNKVGVLFDFMKEAEQNSLVSKVHDLFNESSGVENYMNLRIRLNQRKLAEPLNNVGKKKI